MPKAIGNSYEVFITKQISHKLIIYKLNLLFCLKFCAILKVVCSFKVQLEEGSKWVEGSLSERAFSR